MLDDTFPESIHVKDIEMETSSDTIIWDYAQHEGYTIVSKDSDFHQRSFVFGHPPKVIWIQRGNCSTDEIYRIINSNKEAIRLFGEDKESSFLALE